MIHFLSPEEIRVRKARQTKRKKEKDVYVRKCLSGEMPLSRVPHFLQNQVRGLKAENDSGLRKPQKRVMIHMNGYNVMGAVDGFERGHVVEFKSRKQR